jgi:epoxyqueuosine reductase QueG
LNDSNTKDLKDFTIARGATLCGVADLALIRSDTDLLDPCYDSYTRGISIGVALDAKALAGVDDGPDRAYCNEYLRVNCLLDSIAEDVVSELEARGARAIRIPASEVVDWERLRGHLSHKLIGRYAGLGWVGRSILLINPQFGARVRYVTVLTDFALDPQAPMREDCGLCARCVAQCPANAIGASPADFDMGACLSQLIRFNEILGEPHFICGVCVAACREKWAGESATDGSNTIAPAR